MDRLWSPWRIAYVMAPQPPADADPCFICRYLAESDDLANLILRRTEHSVVMLNRFPYNNGHLLVAPLAHKGKMAELSDAELLDTQRTMARMIDLLQEKMRPEAFNLGLNLGKSAGAGLPGHLHWHIVPRWQADNNFMPVFHDTRIMVQSLDAAWELLAGEGIDN